MWWGLCYRLQRLRPGGGDATFGGEVRDSSGGDEGARTWDDEEVVVVYK